MAIDPKVLEEFATVPYPNVLTRKHVFGTDYAILTVIQVRDGFEGNLSSTTLGINDRVFEDGETMQECRDKLDQRFREIVPDREWGPGCFGDWQRECLIFAEPTGKRTEARAIRISFNDTRARALAGRLETQRKSNVVFSKGLRGSP